MPQINVTKLRRLALDTDGEENDGGEPDSGQAEAPEAPEACDIEFTEILGRWAILNMKRGLKCCSPCVRFPADDMEVTINPFVTQR